MSEESTKADLESIVSSTFKVGDNVRIISRCDREAVYGRYYKWNTFAKSQIYFTSRWDRKQVNNKNIKRTDRIEDLLYF